MALHKKGKDLIDGELSSFKEFVVETNLMSLAVAFLVGGAFRSLLLAIINDVILFKIMGSDPTDYMIGNTNYGNVISASVELMITLITVYVVYRIFSKIGLSKKK